MTRACRACLGDLHPNDLARGYHARCLRALFDGTTVPVVPLDMAKLQTAGLAMVGGTSLSGAQRKISVGLSSDRMTLQVMLVGGAHILKPQSTTYPHLPENEHLTMQLARACGIEVPPFGLLDLADGAPAYIVRRFDRTPEGKLRQEDFCQLDLKTRREKYNGSSELLVRLVRRYASETGVELFRLFRRLLFCWLTGNGDMHLKNFSLLAEREGGRYRLSPAYDLLCTRLVIPDDPLALPLGGRDRRLTRRAWLTLAKYAGLGRAAEREIERLAAQLGAIKGLIAASYLPQEQQDAYSQLVSSRVQRLMR